MQRRGWAVVTTKGGTGAERSVVGRLEAQGFSAYYPRIRLTETRARRVVSIVRPMFPRYVFVKVVGVWRAITGTRGVTGLLMAGDLPDLAPQRVVDAMRGREGPDGIIEMKPLFDTDERVTAKSGSFADLVGRCVGYDGPGRVRVLYEILGRSALRVVLEGDLVAA